MKRILSILMIFAMLMGGLTGFAQTNKQEDVLALLSELNIMKGDPDGNFRLNDTVSRAEFTKVAIAMSYVRNSVASSLTISPFKDVPYTHWASPYIKLGVSTKICSGYPDGTFQPDGAVLYEEGVTMLLKILNYTDADFGMSWPYGQTGLAANLEINKDVGKGVGQVLTRGDVALLVYNTLNTKMKNSTIKLITTLDCQIIENTTLIATNKEDPAVNTGKVVATSGNYDIDSKFNPANVGKKGDIYVKDGDDLIYFSPYDQKTEQYTVTDIIGTDVVLDGKFLKVDDNLLTYYKSSRITYKAILNIAEEGDTLVIYSNASGVREYAVLLDTHSDGQDNQGGTLEKYTVYSTVGGDIVAYHNGILEKLVIESTTAAYMDNVPITYGLLKPALELGDNLYVKYDEKNEIDYVNYEKGNVVGPATVTSSDWNSGFQADMSAITITRDGKKVSFMDILPNDIVYYCKDLNMILGYSNKVTGIYEKALPNKDMPTSVVVSGVTYTIEGIMAFNALYSNGEFEYGDTVTLLLGKTNQIADVISPEQAAVSVTGYLVETGKKQYTKSDNTKYSANYVKLVLPDGKSYEYVADKDYSDWKNDIVRLVFINSAAKISTVSDQRSVWGKFSWSDKKLGDKALTEDLKILEVTTQNPNKEANYKTVFPKRIDGLAFETSSILFADTNEKGEIKALILNDVTGDIYQYGMMMKAQSAPGGAMGQYTFDIHGITQTVATQSVTYGVYGGQPCKFSFNSKNQVVGMQSIEKISGTVEKVALTELQAGSKKYLLSDKVSVYNKSRDSDYVLMDLQDIIGHESSYYLDAYYDKPITSGGRVRVIVATAI